MRDFPWYILIAGIGIGIWIAASMEFFVPTSHRNILKAAIIECEKDLPRSQECVITAIPKQK